MSNNAYMYKVNHGEGLGFKAVNGSSSIYAEASDLNFKLQVFDILMKSFSGLIILDDNIGYKWRLVSTGRVILYYNEGYIQDSLSNMYVTVG